MYKLGLLMLQTITVLIPLGEITINTISECHRDFILSSLFLYIYIDTFNRAFHAIYRLREIYDARFYHSQKLMKRAIKF